MYLSVIQAYDLPAIPHSITDQAAAQQHSILCTSDDVPLIEVPVVHVPPIAACPPWTVGTFDCKLLFPELESIWPFATQGYRYVFWRTKFSNSDVGPFGVRPDRIGCWYGKSLHTKYFALMRVTDRVRCNQLPASATWKSCASRWSLGVPSRDSTSEKHGQDRYTIAKPS